MHGEILGAVLGEVHPVGPLNKTLISDTTHEAILGVLALNMLSTLANIDNF